MVLQAVALLPLLIVFGAAWAWMEGPALDGGHRSAQHGVGLDHFDGEAGAGQVAGGDQSVVPGPDDDDVDAPVARGLPAVQAEPAGVRSGNRAPRMANGRASPGKW